MKHLIAFFAIFLISSNAFSTAQYPDKIIFEGKEYNLNTNPLEEYFEKNPNKRPKSEITSSALWRGYIATFEIKDNILLLKDIKIPQSAENWKSIISEIFPNQTNIKIDWFSGLLVLPFGKRVNYVHMGYGSTFESYYLLEFENGNFKRKIKLNSEEYEIYREDQFTEFKKTEEYKKLVLEIKKEGDSQEFIDSFLKSFVSSYTSIILKEKK
jgi:hypothetical protein